MSGPSHDNPELDALFQASRQVESKLVRERAQTTRLKSELEALRSRQADEIARAKARIQHYATCYEELRSQHQACQARLQQMTAHARKLQEALANAKSNSDEGIQKARVELGVAKSSIQHLQHANRSLENQLAALRPDLARAQSDVERVQAEMLERDHKLQAALLSARAQEKAHQDAIASLKESLRRAQDEIARHQARWLDAERMKQDAEVGMRRQDELQNRLREVTDARAALSERLALEKRRREQAEALAKAAEQEKHLALGAAREAEARMAEAKDRVSRMASEIALLKAAQASAAQAAQHAKSARAAAAPAAGASAFAPPPARHEFEGLEDMAVIGYPVVRGPTRI